MARRTESAPGAALDQQLRLSAPVVDIVAGRALHSAVHQHVLGDRPSEAALCSRGIVKSAVPGCQRRVIDEANRVVVAQVGADPACRTNTWRASRVSPIGVQGHGAIVAAQAGCGHAGARIADDRIEASRWTLIGDDLGLGPLMISQGRLDVVRIVRRVAWQTDPAPEPG